MNQVKFNTFFLNNKKCGRIYARKKSDLYEPQILLNIFKKNDKLYIEIQDNGPGILETIKKRIFEPFYTTKKVNNGTGSGMSVSYFIIIEDHHGTLIIDSKLNEWTKFTISLPVK